MADKNWLIRTKNRQILGPATKQKVIELLEKGSLSSDDEITCGNGYWFWVREKDLIEKYLYGDLPQSFNPISEAQDVLTAKSSADGITASMTASPAAKQEIEQKPVETNETALPDNGDLAYPDDDDLGYPDMGGNEAASAPVAAAVVEEVPATSTAPIPNKPAEPIAPKKEKLSVAPEPPVQGDDNTLFPSDEDLEYPELVGAAAAAAQAQEVDPDSTAEIESVTLAAAKEEFDEDVTDPNIQVPNIEEHPVEIEEEQEELSEPEAVFAEEVSEEDEYENEDEDEQEEPPEEMRPKRRRKKVVKKSGGNDRYLFYIGALLLVVIGVIIYYFKVIINKPIPYVGITSVQAQTISSLSKKKTL